MNEKLTFFTSLLFCAPIAADHMYGSFLSDYFSNKPYTITMHLCWNFGDIFKMLRANHDSKQIAIYRKNKNKFHFLDHLSNDNVFVLDMNDCESSWKILNDVDNLLEFRWPLKFVLLVDEEIFENRLNEMINGYNILPSSDVVVAKRLKTGDFQLLKPYRINKISNAVWEDFGFWNSSLHETMMIPQTSRRRDLNNTNMDVGFLFNEIDSWKHLDDFKYPRIDTFTKQNYGAIKALIEYCNINMTVIPADTWGYYNESTKTWDGLVEMIQDKKIQLSGTSPYFTAPRFEVVDFIKMQNPFTVQFVMKRPPVSSVYNIFTLPFNSNVWKCLGITTAIFTVAIYLAYNWESRTNSRFSQRGRFSLSDVVLVISEVMCQQGTLFEPESTPSRILVLFLFTAFMFIYSSYSAYIIVVLQSTYKINSYKALLDTNIRIGAMDTIYMRHYVEKSESKIQAELYKKKIGPKGYYALEDGMRKVRNEFFAFHCEIAAAFDYISANFDEHETCLIQTMPGYTEVCQFTYLIPVLIVWFQHMRGYTMVPKNFPYKKIFKVGLLKIDEHGIQRRNFFRYVRTPKCYGRGGGFQSIGLLETSNAFVMLIIGCCISMILWFIEVLRYRRANRVATKTSKKPKSLKAEKRNPRVSVCAEAWS